MIQITPKDAMRIIEIADHIIQQVDLSEIDKETYYKMVAEAYNNQYRL